MNIDKCRNLDNNCSNTFDNTNTNSFARHSDNIVSRRVVAHHTGDSVCLYVLVLVLFARCKTSARMNQ